MNRRTISLLACIFFLCLSGCTRDENGFKQYPEQFRQIMAEQDGLYARRQRTLETADIYRCYRCADASHFFLVRADGYEEDMLIGVNMDKYSIFGVDVLYENETEDYGAYITSDWFLDRFIMRRPEKVKLVKRKKENEDEVIAVTGATISSQAVVDAVNKCLLTMEEKK